MGYPIITRDFDVRKTGHTKPVIRLFVAKYAVQFCSLSYKSCL